MAGWPVLDRYLAGQFARPHGPAGRILVGPLLDWIGAPMMDAAFAALEPAAGERVLDLGIGGGALSRRLLKAGAQVTGVDVSDSMLERARRRHAGAVQTRQAQFLAGSAEMLPLQDAAMDKAASVNSVYFWTDLDAGMAELARVLRPGGRLVVGHQTAEAVRAWPGHVHGFRAWADADVTAAVEAAQLRVIDIREAWHRRVRDYRTLIALRD